MSASYGQRAHNLALAAMAEVAGFSEVRCESIRQGCYSDAQVARMIEDKQLQDTDAHPQRPLPLDWE